MGHGVGQDKRMPDSPQKRNAKISTRWLKFLNLKELLPLYVILVELIEAEDDLICF